MPGIDLRRASASSSSSASNLVLRRLSVEDYGAVSDSNGTSGHGTDNTAAFRAAYDAALLILAASDYVGVEIVLPSSTAGAYRVTDWIVTTPDAAGANRAPIKGVHWVGKGKRATEVFFDRSAASSSDPTQNTLFVLGNRAQAWRFSKMTFRSANSANSCFYLWCRDDGDNTLLRPEFGKGAQSDFIFTDVQWMGAWNRGIGLDGDQQANLNSEIGFDYCALHDSATFADAWFSSGITTPSTYDQQDQFLNYWFRNCKMEYTSGVLLKFTRGGSINIDGGSYILLGNVAGSTFFSFPTVPFKNEGVCRFHCSGVRFELRGVNNKIIDSYWTKGNIVFDTISDEGYASVLGSAAAEQHKTMSFNFNANGTANRGPHVTFRDSVLSGYHEVTTHASTPLPSHKGKFRYDGCRMFNNSTGTFSGPTSGTTGMLRYTGLPVPYRLRDVWDQDDYDSEDNDPLTTQGLTSGESNVSRLLAASSSVSIVSQQLRLAYFTARKSETITQVRVPTGGTAASGLTLARIGLYEVSSAGGLTLVASTANDTTMFGSANSDATAHALTASYSKVRGRRYAVGVLCIGTTMPTVTGLTTSGGNGTRAARGPRLAGLLAGQTDLPSSVTDASLTNTSTYFAADLLP